MKIDARRHRFLVFFLLAALPTVGNGQTDSVYLSKYFSPVLEELGQEAHYVRYLTSVEGDRYRAEDYTLEEDLRQRGVVRLKFKSAAANPVKAKHTMNGYFERFYENGQREYAGNYVDNQKTGSFQYWHPNGQEKAVLEFSRLTQSPEYRVVSFYDTLGQQLVVNGKGIYHQTGDPHLGFNVPFSSGPVKNGLKHGVWEGYWTNSSGLNKRVFEERYRAGRLVKGTSVDSLGQQRRYKEAMTQPTYGKRGMGDFMKHIGQTIKYPTEARRIGIEGRVFVQFTVAKDGTVEDAKVIRGIGTSCDREALRAVQTAKGFNPGRYRGWPVRTKMVVPILFQIG